MQFDKEVLSKLANPDGALENALIFLDIDGVLADPSPRLPYYETKEWDKFYGCAMADDGISLNYETAMAMLAGVRLTHKNSVVVFLTGRPERTRGITSLWIQHNVPVFDGFNVGDEGNMLMRNDEDFRVGFKMKWEAMEKYLRQNIGDYADFDLFFLDDDYRNVKYCGDKLEYAFPEVACNFHGVVVGHNRLPSVHAVENTSDLGSSK